jgi:hypothetical protein
MRRDEASCIIEQSQKGNKSFSNQPKQNSKSDSSTVVNFVLDEPQKTVGFKCNKKLWDAFVDARALRNFINRRLETMTMSIW